VGPGGDEAVDQCEAASIARSECIDEEEGKLNQGVGGDVLGGLAAARLRRRSGMVTT
jgi:hypothetical protein